MVCRHCGCENLEGTKLCVFCGEAIEEQDQSVSRIMTAFAGEGAPDEAAAAAESDIQVVSAMGRLRKTDVGSDWHLSEGEGRVALDEARALMHGTADETLLAAGAMAGAAAGEDLSRQAARIVEQAVERIVSDQPEAAAVTEEVREAAAEAEELAAEVDKEDLPEEEEAALPTEGGYRRGAVVVPPSPLNFEMEEAPAEEIQAVHPETDFVKKAAAEVPFIALTDTTVLQDETVPHIQLTDTESTEAAVAGMHIRQEDLETGVPAIPLFMMADAAHTTEIEEEAEAESAYPDGPSGGDDERGGRKKWLLPLLLLLLAGGAVVAGVHLLGGGKQNPQETGVTTESRATAESTQQTESDTRAGGESTQAESTEETVTTAESTTGKATTAATSTTAETETTTAESTATESTTAEVTTEAPTTTVAPATTVAPTTTAAPTTMAAETTTVAPTTEAREKNPFYFLAKAQVGEVIRFGSYEQDGNPGEEPIQWIVLAKNEGRILVISRYCFLSGVYSTAKPAVWSTSQARSFLNGSFLSSAFNQEERNQIKAVTVKTPANPQTGRKGGDSTTDSVFLLSIQEVQQYMSVNWIKTAATPTARSAGAYEQDGVVYWWLRSAGESATYVAHTGSGGIIDYAGEKASVAGALRPAMWLNADQAEFLP